MKTSFPYARHGALFLVGQLIMLVATAQNIPTNSTKPSAIPATPPAGYTNTAISFIRTWEPSMQTSDPAAVMGATDIGAVKQSTYYVDGLGRPVQTVNKGISPSGKDIVTPFVYDALGREEYKYLPYTAQTGNSSDGKFKTDPFSAQQSFYQNTGLNPGISGETIFYRQLEYDASPLNRVQKSYAPGNNWAKTGGNKPIIQSHLLNTVADGVRIWVLPSSSIIPVSTQVYEGGQLFKEMTIDERGNKVIEFIDKEGRPILKKEELVSGAADGHNNWLCTYYVYDNVGNVRCVIPPKAVELIKSNWTLTSDVLQELCYLYRYDGRNRLIVKKIPGADSTEFVYDTRDRLVFSRDGNLKLGTTPQWMVTYYDVINRPSMTGFYKSNATREVLQTTMNVITASNPQPNISTSDLTPLTYTYYDNYSYSGAISPVTSDYSKPQAGTNLYAEPTTAATTFTRGLITGSKQRVLGTETWLTASNYYTDKGRLVQMVSNNINNGQDVTTNLYDFNGKLLSQYQRHNNIKSTLTPQSTLLTSMNYDKVGRLTQVSKQLNDNAATQSIIAMNNYDELGQLKDKNLGVKSGVPIETLNFEYNIRGWVKSINKNFVNTSGSSSNWFGQDLSYDEGFQANQYNGNIAGIKWKSKSDGIARAYGYNYDPTNRLMKADFTQNNTGSWSNSVVDFSVKMGDGIDPASAYDANGNILSMMQRGLKGGASTTIDQLTYSYLQNQVSNRLQGVADAFNDPSSTLGDFKEINGSGLSDYSYDYNGNLTSDFNKGINTITYNHLNLPSTITVTGKGTISYLYDAAGNRYRKIVTDNTVTPAKVTTTDYLGAFIYQNDTLQFVSHEEGRIRAIYKSGQPVAYTNDYFIKDHLGNVRMVLTEQSDFSMYAATMETGNAINETALFSNIDETRAAKPVGFPSENAKTNQSVAKLSAAANGKKIGPSLVLRVMAGDTIQIGTKAFYKSNGPNSENNKMATAENMLADLISAFNSGAKQGGDHNVLADNNSTPFTAGFYNNDYQRLKQKEKDQVKVDRPKAYLNFVLFDDQFNLIEENSGVKQVKAEPDQLQILGQDKMTMKKSGYLYVYTSNESVQDVYFDDLAILATPGPLLEETHYYPFGLIMAGISSSALRGKAYPENRKKFNGIEHTTEFDLNTYDAFYRTLDPQIGRFWQIDPKPTGNISLYAMMDNNPISKSDPLGDSIPKAVDQRIAARIEKSLNTQMDENNQSSQDSQTKIANNNKEIEQLKNDIGSGKIAGRKDVKKANKRITKLERSTNWNINNIVEMWTRNNLLSQSLADINSLRTDENYNYTFEKPGNGSIMHTVYKREAENGIENKDVVIQGSNDGLYIHEIRHIGQSLAAGGLSFSESPNTKGRLKYASVGRRQELEVNAYQTQFSLDPLGYPATRRAFMLSDINIESLKSILGEDGNAAY
ncbi:hypothetical protein DVR12_17095 [Chitinophaga silvatica]|uniref:DUF6443 domain-containing protein n=1 Tax=Chitinophaga silvatica TaxID=2282649 RepID=A0A3E1Y7K1_9BACT|nr:DUF6443 domain-containing protein [Chitinophaga silvatica]RFS21057.1 hypothetical protein DVR12_17095 [Chitinophaga silvatica]